MGKHLGWRMVAVALTASLPLLSACSSDDKSKSELPAPVVVPATAQPETVIAESYAETEATVQAIDRKTRSVTLRMADGRTETLQAPADADLTKVKKNDIVILGAFQRVSVQALPPGSAPLGVRREVATMKAEPGQTPGRAAAERTVVVTEVAAVDAINNTVTLRNAGGEVKTLNVRNYENQQKLKTLKIGDLVQIEVIEAGGVQLKPKPKAQPTK